MLLDADALAGGPVAYQLVRTMGWAALRRQGREDYRFKVAVAGCVVPAAPPRDSPDNALALDELALCASLRRQGAEVRRFLSAE
jgi:hypothetical protein